MDGNTSLLELNNVHNWIVEFCFEIFQLFFFDSDKYADLIYNSIHLGVIKPELKNYEVSSCFFCSFDKGTLRLLFSVKCKPFWVVQGNSRCVLLYFPEDRIAVSLLKTVSNVMLLDLNHSYESIPNDILVNKIPLQFSGCLLGYPRPYHYYADHVSGLFELTNRLRVPENNYLTLTYTKDEFFLDVDFLLPEKSFSKVKSCKEISHRCSVGFAYLRLVRGSKQSYQNYNFRRILISQVLKRLREEDKIYFKDIATGYDLILLVGIANEKRSWIGQVDAINELLHYLVNYSKLNVLLILDGMTCPVKISEPVSFHGRKSTTDITYEQFSFKVDIYDSSWMGTQEKLFISQYVDFAITNALTDSINVSRFSAVDGLGFSANSFNVEGNHLHPKYSLLPKKWIVNDSNNTAADKVSFTVKKDKFLGLAKEMIQHKLDQKLNYLENFNKVRLLDDSFDLNDIMIPLGRSILSIAFKGESEDTLKLHLIFEVHSRSSLVTKHKLFLGRQLEFDFEVAEIRNFRVLRSGYGSYSFDGVRLIFDEAPFYMTL